MKIFKQVLIILSVLSNLFLFYCCYELVVEKEEIKEEYKFTVEMIQKDNHREWNNISEEEKEKLTLYYTMIRSINKTEAQYMIDSYRFLYDYEIGLENNLISQGYLYKPIYIN